MVRQEKMINDDEDKGRSLWLNVWTMDTSKWTQSLMAREGKYYQLSDDHLNKDHPVIEKNMASEMNCD